MVNNIRAGFRFFIFLCTAVWTVFKIMVNVNLGFRKGQDYILEARRKWVNKIIPRVGVDLSFTGSVPEVNRSAIYVQNHRSYFDPVTALKLIKAMPVSKAEVSTWPFIGFAAKYTGVLYVQRQDRQSRADTLQAMEEEIDKGNNILIYPEGTTTSDAKTLQFKLGSFRLAAKRGIPIIPMSIEFSKDEDSWIGTDLFLSHFFKTFGKKRVYIRVGIGEPILGDNPERLLEQTQDWIDKDILKQRAIFAEQGHSRD